MATGDLVVRDGQYEFQQLLFNNLPARPSRIIHSARGLYGFSQNTTSKDKQADHGGFPGQQYLKTKMIELDGTTDCDTATQAQAEIDVLSGAWQSQTAEIPFVFQKAGQTKRFIYVRPLDLEIPTGFQVGRGLLKWDGRLEATDPRIYSLAQKTTTLTIGAGSTTTNGTPVNDGFFFGGSYPVLEIDGPCINPRITNAGDDGRAVRLDGTLTAGQTLVIDSWFKTVTIAGVDVIGTSWTVRTDNQWWKLWPSSFRTNTVTFARSGTTGSSVLRIKFRDAWA